MTNVLRYSSPITRPIWLGDFHETSPNSMWAFYTSYQLTLTKNFFVWKPHSQDPKKGTHLEIFGDFQRNFPGGTNNVHKWLIFILGDLAKIKYQIHLKDIWGHLSTLLRPPKVAWGQMTSKSASKIFLGQFLISITKCNYWAKKHVTLAIRGLRRPQHAWTA